MRLSNTMIMNCVSLSAMLSTCRWSEFHQQAAYNTDVSIRATLPLHPHPPKWRAISSTVFAGLTGVPSAFSALTLLVGHQEQHPACKNWVMRCWCGYLSAARWRLFAYGPAHATATPKPYHLLPHLNPDWFYLSVPIYPGYPGKEAVKRVQY